MSFLRNSLSLLFGATLVQPLGFIINVALARLLIPEDLGSYMVAVALGRTAAPVFHLGIPNACIYRIQRQGASPDQVAGTAFVLTLIIGAVPTLAGFVLAPWISSHLLEGTPLLATFFGIALIYPQMFGSLFVGLAAAHGRFDLQNVYRGITFGGLLVALLVAAVTVGPSLNAFLAATFVTYATAAAVIGLTVLRHSGVAWRPIREEVSDQLRFGARNYLHVLAGRLHEQIDIFILAFLLVDPASIGFYAIAVGIVSRMKLIPSSIAAVLFPRVASENDAAAARFTARVARHAILAVLATAIGIAIAAPALMPLIYGRAFSASVLPLLLLLPGMIGFSIHLVLARYFMGVSRQSVIIGTRIISLVWNIALNLLLIPRFGILGAAFASLVSYSLEAALILGAFMWKSRVPLKSVFFVRAEELRILAARLRVLRCRANGKRG